MNLNIFLRMVLTCSHRLSAMKISSFIGVIFFMLMHFSCKKDENTDAMMLTGTMTDIDGNVYQTVKIGDDWWMAENLAVTKFRDGSSIEIIQNDAALWTKGNPGACRFENNAEAPGLLYNWFAVNHPSKLAPKGWHIATEQEWQRLERHLGMNVDEIEKYNWRRSGSCGDKLKIKGPTGWYQVKNVWGTNESGFSALAGACRLWNGNWAQPGLRYSGFWWSSSETDYTNAYFRNLDYKESGIFRFYADKRYGMSVRCVKD